jgi:hypothetical protein
MKKATQKTSKPAPRWTLKAVKDSRDRKKLSPVQLEQLAVLATFYDGLETSPETIPPGLFNQWVKLSRVLEGGEHRFDLWMIGRDEGCLFWKDDPEPVGIEVIQGGWDAYPKQGWVKRGLKLDLRHLAWELAYREGPPPPPNIPEPEPEPEKPSPMRWKPKRKRKTPDDC